MCGATEPTNSAEGPYLRGRSHGHSGRMPFAFVAVALVVLGVNVLPAFGPPTWALLVLFHLHWHLAPVPLIVVGALSAASGRLLLAAATARLQGRLSETRRARIARLGATVQQHKTSAVAGLALFALSPVPSGQLFVAAGLLRLRIRPLTLAFFAGRVVSYSLYLTAAQVAERSFGDVVLASMRSPLALGLQAAFLATVTALPLVDWSALRKRGATRRRPRQPQHAAEARPRPCA